MTKLYSGSIEDYSDNIEDYNYCIEAYEDQEQTIQRLQSALRAVRARINGEWHQPDLVAAGPLMTNKWSDVYRLDVCRFIDEVLAERGT